MPRERKKCKATIFLDIKSDFDPRLRGGSVLFFHQEPSRKVNENLVDVHSKPKCPDNVIKVVISTRVGKSEQITDN